MRILVDTGVLLRIFDRSSSIQPTILRALKKLWSQNHELCSAAQNIAEFWNVSTRPAASRGGLGLSLSLVNSRVRGVERMVTVLPFSSRAYNEWRHIVVAQRIIGVSVHDARLVATMTAESVPAILTLNEADFRRYASITILTPTSVLAS